MAHTTRMARPFDAPVLATIDACVNRNPWTESQFSVACSFTRGAREWALVAEEAGSLDGFVVVSQVLDEASILSLAVDPGQQRRGLGLLLLQAALSRAQRAGATRCLLEVRRSNVAARTLYERNGFVLDGVRENYYPITGGREDALLMSCVLKGTANERA